MREDTHNELGEMISGMNRFINQNCIEDEEFINWFLDNLNISKPANFLIDLDRKENLGKINEKFSNLNINALSLIEGK